MVMTKVDKHREKVTSDTRFFVQKSVYNKNVNNEMAEK